MRQMRVELKLRMLSADQAKQYASLIDSQRQQSDQLKTQWKEAGQGERQERSREPRPVAMPPAEQTVVQVFVSEVSREYRL